MFVKAIQQVSGFTAPLKFITRNYKSTTVRLSVSLVQEKNENGGAMFHHTK
jgi:hypothetical protein